MKVMLNQVMFHEFNHEFYYHFWDSVLFPPDSFHFIFGALSARKSLTEEANIDSDKFFFNNVEILLFGFNYEKYSSLVIAHDKLTDFYRST